MKDITAQLTFTCSKSTIETVKKGVKYMAASFNTLVMQHRHSDRSKKVKMMAKIIELMHYC